LPLSRSLLDRAQDALADWAGRLGNRGGGISQMAVGSGAGGAGFAGMAKAVVLCVGAASGAAACVAGGVIPTPFEAGHERAPALERRIDPILEESHDQDSGVAYEPATPAKAPPIPKHSRSEAPAAEPAPVAGGEAVESVPEPEPVAVSEPIGESPAGPAAAGSPAGEFGP
jgi:hypothetical protein